MPMQPRPWALTASPALPSVRVEMLMGGNMPGVAPQTQFRHTRAAARDRRASSRFDGAGMDNLIAGVQSLVAGGKDLAIAGLAIVALAEAAIILLRGHSHARWRRETSARERDLGDALAQARRQTATTAPGVYSVAGRSG